MISIQYSMHYVTLNEYQTFTRWVPTVEDISDKIPIIKKKKDGKREKKWEIYLVAYNKMEIKKK